MFFNFNHFIFPNLIGNFSLSKLYFFNTTFKYITDCLKILHILNFHFTCSNFIIDFCVLFLQSLFFE